MQVKKRGSQVLFFYFLEKDPAVQFIEQDQVMAIAQGRPGGGGGGSTPPARVNGPTIYTISAHNINGVFASFSNFGNPPIDYSAPGVSVQSTWLSGGHNTISGTSMAAPHAAGVLMLGSAKANGFVTGDKDSAPNPKISR